VHDDYRVRNILFSHDQGHIHLAEWFTVMWIQQGLWIWKFLYFLYSQHFNHWTKCKFHTWFSITSVGICPLSYLMTNSSYVNAVYFNDHYKYLSVSLQFFLSPDISHYFILLFFYSIFYYSLQIIGYTVVMSDSCQHNNETRASSLFMHSNRAWNKHTMLFRRKLCIP